MADRMADARPISRSGNSLSASKTPPQKEARKIDLPLYVSALIGILAAFMSVNAVLGSDTITWASYAIAVAGTGFSIFYRKMNLPPVLLNIAFGLVIVLFLAVTKLGWINVDAIVPYASLQGDLTLAFVIQCLTALYTFIMIDDKRVLMSSIVSMALIGLVATYNIDGTLIFDFLVYMLATIFLLLHQSFQMFQAWGAFTLSPQRRRLLLLIQIACSVIGASISLSVATLLVTPLQAVGSHLSLAGALRSLANLAPTNAANDASAAVVPAIDDDDTSTIAIGTGPTTEGDTQTVLLRMIPSDEQPHYLRGRTYDHYTGNGWISTLKGEGVAPSHVQFNGNILQYYYPTDPADEGVDPKNYGPQYQIEVDVQNYSSGSFYSVPNIATVGLPFPERFVVRLAPNGQVQLPQVVSHVSYLEYARTINAPPAKLMNYRSTDYPPEIKRLYVDQKGDKINQADALLLSKTATSIVDSLPPSHRTEFDEAYAIQNWVSKQAKYSLSVTPVPAGKDAVVYFLFTAREGYCDLFASSMAVLCRYSGIPARLATGFDSGQMGKVRGYEYTEANRHAWVEVYIPGYGWQQFDPTMGSVLASQHAAQNPIVAWLASQIDFLLHGSSQATFVPRILTGLIICAIVLILRNEVVARIMRHYGRSGNGAKTTPAVSKKTRSAVARTAAMDRWQKVVKHGRQWRPPQHEHETSLEYTRSLVSAISIAAQITGSKGERFYDPQVIVGAVQRLSVDYVHARYSSEEDQDDSLILRNENGDADKDLAGLTHAASRIPRNAVQMNNETVESFSYLHRPLTIDPLNAFADSALSNVQPSDPHEDHELRQVGPPNRPKL